MYMAKIYEKKGDYELASRFYSEASRTTMSDLDVKRFTEKAKELRQKAGLSTGSHEN